MIEFSLNRVFARAWAELNRGITSYLMLMVIGIVAGIAMIVIGVIALIPFGLGSFFATSGDTASAIFSIGVVAVVVIVLLLLMAVSALLSLMQLEVTSQLFSGYQPDVHVAYQWAIRRFWRMLGLFIVLTIAMIVGYLLFILPGIFLSVVWALAPYILVKEDLGPMEALQRSMTLTLRAFWWVFLALFILMATAMVLSLLQIIPFVGVVIGFVVSIGIGLYTQPYYGAIYEELRRIEEGPGQPAVVPTDSTPPVAPEEVIAEAAVVAVAEPEAAKVESSELKVEKKVTRPAKKTSSKKTA